MCIYVNGVPNFYDVIIKLYIYTVRKTLIQKIYAKVLFISKIKQINELVRNTK